MGISVADKTFKMKLKKVRFVRIKLNLAYQHLALQPFLFGSNILSRTRSFRIRYVSSPELLFSPIDFVLHLN
jgi:hypothetical protein